MTNPDPRGAGRPPHDDEVPVRTRPWCTVVMVPVASFMCMAQTSFASLRYEEGTAGYLWIIFSLFVGMAAGFVLVARNEYPEATFWLTCMLVVVFPFDSLIVLMAMASLIARRSSRAVTVRSIVAAALVALYSQLRDALSPPDASLWHMVFARPNTGGNTGVPIDMITGETTVIVTAIVAALIETAIATLAGLHVRSRAILQAANAKADAAASQAQNLRVDLDNQQLADAIAAEAHDTLAHSLSLIALNASALQAESEKLADHERTAEGDVRRQASSIIEQSRQIRRQAAGALDEAHSIIDMLRHPEQARLQLAPSDDTALTRESLEALMSDARGAGMRLNTWIDIQQLSDLDENIGKIAYRTIQEGLTNARRHAAGMPVSLEVGASPDGGVHIQVSNPTTQGRPGTDAKTGVDAGATDTTPLRRGGAGLAGITARARSVGGRCAYGPDDHGTFHIDVRLPWLPASRASERA